MLARQQLRAHPPSNDDPCDLWSLYISPQRDIICMPNEQVIRAAPLRSLIKGCSEIPKFKWDRQSRRAQGAPQKRGRSLARPRASDERGVLTGAPGSRRAGISMFSGGPKLPLNLIFARRMEHSRDRPRNWCNRGKRHATGSQILRQQSGALAAAGKTDSACVREHIMIMRCASTRSLYKNELSYDEASSVGARGINWDERRGFFFWFIFKLNASTDHQSCTNQHLHSIVAHHDIHEFGSWW